MKKTILILIGIMILGGGLYLFIQAKQSPSTGESTSESTGFRSFFPFNTEKRNASNEVVDNTNTEANINTTVEENIIEEENRLTQITNFAISGMTVFMAEKILEEDIPSENNNEDTQATLEEDKNTNKEDTANKKELPKTETIEAIRYVEKATGHVYEYSIKDKQAGKISNSTIPGVQEAIFLNNNQSVLFRYIGAAGKIQSYIATFGESEGKFLAEGVNSVSISPDKKNIFYLSPLADSVAGLNFSIDSKTSKQIFSSDFTEWLPQWVSKNVVFLTTKPSWNIDGSVYALNTTSGALTKIFGNTKGLTTLGNGLGDRIIYNKNTTNGPLLGVFANNGFTSLDLYGLPEKCVWSKDNFTVYCAIPRSITTARLPDYWYQGIVSFDDMIIKIDTNNNLKSIIFDSGVSVDATNLALSPNENALFFTDKKDGTLWMLSI